MFLDIIYLSFICAICQSIASKIGNYSQYIADYKQCGLSGTTIKEESTLDSNGTRCFQYNQEMSGGLRDARDIESGEAPWVVSVEQNSYLIGIFPVKRADCGGVLITDRWVLTAAHCLNKDDWFYIYFSHKSHKSGAYIKAIKIILHPEWEKDSNSEKTKYKYDVGMIKMETSVDIKSKDEDYYRENIICLPASDFYFNRKKIVMAAGWGGGFDRLQIGPKTANINKQILYTGRLLGRSKGCKGDSGSPLWFYHMGRAFLVGISSKFRPDASDPACGGAGSATYVPLIINWILYTIRDE